jgi:hypothetical protein
VHAPSPYPHHKSRSQPPAATGKRRTGPSVRSASTWCRLAGQQRFGAAPPHQALSRSYSFVLCWRGPAHLTAPLAHEKFWKGRRLMLRHVGSTAALALVQGYPPASLPPPRHSWTLEPAPRPATRTTARESIEGEQLEPRCGCRTGRKPTRPPVPHLDVSPGTGGWSWSHSPDGSISRHRWLVAFSPAFF